MPVCHIECRGVAGGVELQASNIEELSVGAGAVGGPAGAAGDGRDLRGLDVNNADGRGVVTIRCHIQLIAGDSKAYRGAQLSVGAGAVVAPVAPAGEGRDLLGIGIDHADGVANHICHVQLGAGDSQALWNGELSVGADAVVAPVAPAGEGRDLLGPGIDHADGVVILICHVQLGAGDSQAGRSVEHGVGAGAVGGPRAALNAGEGRDLLRLGVDNADGVVTVICHVQLGAGDSQAVRK